MTDINILEMAEHITEMVESLIDRHGAIELKAEDFGMDPRAGNRIYLDHDTSSIFVLTSRAESFEYYSGFSYIQDEKKSTIGDYVVYHHPDNYEGSNRVRVAVDWYKTNRT